MKDQLRTTHARRIWLPLAAGLGGAALLSGLYFSLVSWAESPQHAVDLFWEDRWIVIPILLGFGVQTGLYTILKLRLFIPVSSTGSSGAAMGAGGATSSLAMVACCAHHVTDVLPILGVSAAAAFLAQYRLPFMLAGLGMTMLGTLVMLSILLKARRMSAIHPVTMENAPAMLENT